MGSGSGINCDAKLSRITKLLLLNRCMAASPKNKEGVASLLKRSERSGSSDYSIAATLVRTLGVVSEVELAFSSTAPPMKP